MANVLERLTEGTVFSNKAAEGAALVSKWQKSGLLEGIGDEHQRNTMATLLENQAKELLREANVMTSGDVQGFAAVAFPIVRRVFAGLIANDLVSVQPMSLPSGLVFFMDFRYGDDVGLSGSAGDAAIKKGESLYGDKVGQQVREGINVDGNAYAEKGFYALTSGYGTARIAATVVGTAAVPVERSLLTSKIGESGSLVRYDPDLQAEPAGSKVTVFRIASASIPNFDLIAEQDLTSLSIASGSAGTYTQGSPFSQGINFGQSLSEQLVRRLTKIYTAPNGAKSLQLTFLHTGDDYTTSNTLGNNYPSLVIEFPIKDKLTSAEGADGGLGTLKAMQPWALEASQDLKEIQLKVDSFSITARTRKLKAAWTPELGQDLNAYHNLDAEVELTSILSEQIGLEIDQEILNDLVKGATAGVKYWSRRPGKFVNKLTGEDIGATTGAGNYSAPPDFTGNVSMWYETLLETVNDVSALIHRKTLRGGANFIIVSPEVANILEFTAGFRATVTHDSEKGSTGAVKVGALNSKFDVIVDPYFPRNVILVGRKGSSFLESGYVYAPYVPLQTSPTIFDPKDFTPRKAVMTRYGKAFVRPDMYGIVVIQDLNG